MQVTNFSQELNISKDTLDKAHSDSKTVLTYIQENQGKLFETTMADPGRQLRFSRRATQLPVSFQLALPISDGAEPKDMSVYLHFKPCTGVGIIEIGRGGFKKIRLSGECSVRTQVLSWCATATPLPESDKALESVSQEIKIAEVFQNAKYLMQVNSSVTYKGKNNRRKVNIVMPLAEQDFEKILAKGELNPAKRKGWNLQLLEGLDEMHAKGIIHRDLKPANIMVRADGTIVITDFGMASNLKERVEYMKGSPLYFSPEKHRFSYLSSEIDKCKIKLGKMSPNSQEYKEVRRKAREMIIEKRRIEFDKSDVFAMGMILFQMKNQKAPIKNESDEALPDFAKWMIRANKEGRYNHNVAYLLIKQWNEMKHFKPNDSEDEVIFRMLKLYPEERPTAKVALEELNRVYFPNQA